MGQAPSTPELPPQWSEVLPHITREDVVLSSMKKCRISEDKSVYLNDELFDLDEHVPLALEILNAHPHLKDLRFKLVPGRMPEEKFWAAVFGILNDGGIDVIVGDVGGKVEIDDDYETGDEIDRREDEESNDLNSPLAQSPHHDRTENISQHINEKNYVNIKVKEQQLLISRLQKSLREANHKIRKLGLELHKERKSRHDESISAGGNERQDGGEPNLKHMGSFTHCPKCNTKLTAQRPHKGQWEMHPDCKEFLKLDDHLKENLRKEKEKRMMEVMSQMKFILDTEDLKDTYGKWSCCGKEEYEAEGCAE